jgi:hypothetical protein
VYFVEVLSTGFVGKTFSKRGFERVFKKCHWFPNFLLSMAQNLSLFQSFKAPSEKNKVIMEDVSQTKMSFLGKAPIWLMANLV